MSIIDSSPKPKTVTLNNGAAISSLRSRFGGASLYLNNGAYASVADNTDFGFGTGDFTVELWVYAYDNNNWRTLFEIGSYTSGILWRMGTGGDNLYINNSQYNWNPGNVPLNSWSHLALVRSGSTVKVFINGTASLSISNGGDLGASKSLFIGGRTNGSETFSGFMDEIRITKGIGSAKYTSNFDIKTLHAPFPSTGTPVTPPNAPTELIAGPLVQKINMIWTAPAEDNGGIITDYSIQYSTDGTNWTDFAHSPSVVPAISVTGLTNGTTYSVRVGAVNYTGIGSYVSESNLVPAEPAVDTNPDPYFYSTSLLLHFDESHNSTNIVDSSYLPKTSTAQGDAKISIARNKFGGSSMYFDGSGDYVTIPDHPGFDFGAEDFTIEYWEYRTDSTSGRSVMCRTNTDQGYNPFLIGYAANNRVRAYFCQDPNYDNWNIASEMDMGAISLNNWVHYAVVRQGNTLRTYQNGTQITTRSSSGRIATGTGPLNIGRYHNTAFYAGYLDDIRITRGVCRYPDGTIFTPPTLPFSNIAPTITAPEAPPSITAYGRDASAEIDFSAPPSDKSVLVSYDLQYTEDTDPQSWTSVSSSPTRLLLHFNKGDIRGNAKVKDYSLYNRNVLWNTNNNPAFIGGASSAGTYQKFGTGCLDIQYNRTSGYSSPYIVKVDSSSDLNPGTGNYTLEMFVMFDEPYAVGGIGRLFGSHNGSSGSYFGIQNIDWNTVRIHKYVNGSSVYSVNVSGSLRGNTNNYGVGQYNKKPIHLAFCRNNGTMRIFLEGAKILEIADTNNDNFSSGGLVIMGGESASHNPNNYILGRLDELRYTVGEALYTEAFTAVFSTEFANARVINLPNNKNYIFRVRAQNSGGYSNYLTSSSTLVAPPPVLTITSAPKNDRVISYNESTTFTVTATIPDNSALTYQWQKYDTDINNYYGDYGRSWQNIDGATSSSLTINTQSFNAANNYSYNSPAGKDPVRCVVTSAYSTTVVTPAVRLVNLSYNYYNYEFYHDYNRHTGQYETINNKSYFGLYANANERLNIGVYANGYGPTPDNSWYTGNDTALKFQYSLNPAEGLWTYTNSANDINLKYISYGNTDNHLTPLVDLSGRVYFRTVLKDLWPYSGITNGSSSTTESEYSVVQDGYNNYFYIDFTAIVPSSVTNFAADPGDQLVALSWTKGNSGGLPSSTTYSIEYSTDQTNWTTFTDTLAFSNSGIYVTGLTNGTTYYFRMKAVNSVGSSSYTSIISATPNISEATVPSIINNLTGAAGDSRALLTWDSPADDGRSLPISYNVRYSTDGGNNWIDYQEVPPPPPNFTINQTSVSGVQLNWSNELVLPAITGYLVQYSNDGGNNWTSHIETPPTPPTFSPSSISGLQLWLDSSDASTLYDSTSGGSLVAADGSVARWEDKSGNGRHATQGTSANRPLRKAGVVSAKDALFFDGSNDGLEFSGNIENGSGHVSLFVVAQKTSTSSIGLLVNKDNPNVNPRAHQFLRINGSNVETHWWTPSLRAPTKGSISANTTFLAALRLGADNGFVGLNGVDGTADTNVSGITTTNQPTQIGAYPYNNEYPWSGYICEIVAYNSKISDAEADLVEAYLISKWGIV
jgi:hypothetical protein